MLLPWAAGSVQITRTSPCQHELSTILCTEETPGAAAVTTPAIVGAGAATAAAAGAGAATAAAVAGSMREEAVNQPTRL